MRQHYKVWFHSWTKKWYVSPCFPTDKSLHKRTPFIVANTLDAALNKLHARIIKYGGRAAPAYVIWEPKIDKRSRDFSKFIRST